MGWNMKDEPVEKIEVIPDTNPDTYKLRAVQALMEKRFDEAVSEAEMAIKYGDNQLQYHIWKAKIFFQMQDYGKCMEYIKGQGLWDNRNDINIPEEERNFLVSGYAACSLLLMDNMNYDLEWEIQRKNRKLLVLFEIIMENCTGEAYDINTENLYNRALERIRSINKEISHVGHGKDDISSFFMPAGETVFTEKESMCKNSMGIAAQEMMQKLAQVKENIKV